MTMLVRLLLANALSPMEVSAADNSIVVKELSSNALSPIDVTVPGSTSVSGPSQPLKALAPIDVSPSGKVIDEPR